MFKLFKFLSPNQMVKRSSNVFSCFNHRCRQLADKPRTDATNKQVVVQGTENEQRMRVRRARPSDVPRVLRFVRENSRSAWPNLVAPSPSSASHLALNDYVARALAQGHSMLAEQHEVRRGWVQIRGLALGVAVCPWDAALLERWARCVRCVRSRRLLHYTAHCLRAPGLHDKYRVNNILQVILIVPTETPQNAEIVHVLAKSAIQRGRDVGFPLLRFDVTNDEIAKALDDLQLKKEWHLSFNILPEAIQEKEGLAQTPDPESAAKGNFIAVYTALTQADKT